MAFSDEYDIHHRIPGAAKFKYKSTLSPLTETILTNIQARLFVPIGDVIWTLNPEEGRK